MSDVKAKMHQNRFRLRLSPRPRLHCSPCRPLAEISGPTSKEMGEMQEGEGRRRREKEGKRWEGTEGGQEKEGKGKGVQGTPCVSLNFP